MMFFERPSGYAPKDLNINYDEQLSCKPTIRAVFNMNHKVFNIFKGSLKDGCSTILYYPGAL